MIDPSDFMSAAEVKELLGSRDKTNKILDRHRKKYWLEDIHYVQPVQRIRYVRPMIIDWLLNHKNNPMAHQDAMEAWLAKTQNRPGRSRKKAG
jgi:hypothetical protein